MEHLFSRLFVPKTIHSHGGTFVLGNEWSIDNSFPRTNEPWTFRSLDHLFTETFVPSYKKSCEGFYDSRIRDSTSGIAAKLRSPHTCDLKTMVVLSSAQLMVPERVTTGVRESFRAAG